MRGIQRVVVVLAGLASLLAMASSAGAVTWHNTGDTAFTAINSSSNTLSVTGVNQVCTGTSSTGTAAAGSIAGTTYVGINMTTTFTGCSLSGSPIAWECTERFTTTSQVSTTFPGTLDTRCEMSQFNTVLCVIEGQTAVTYHNPVAPSIGGRFTFTHSSTLRTTDGSGGSCPYGTGEPLTLPGHTRTITAGTGGPSPHLGPVLTRTA